MKHPALTRAMAFTLAIVSIILLLVGSSGMKKAEELKAEAAAEHSKYVERIELYEKLSAELEGLEAYKSADEALGEREAQHDKDAARHRTDVATHTATEGGYKTGADALWDARAQLEEGSIGYYAGLQQYNAKKAEFEKLKSGVQGMSALAAACTMASAQAAVTVPVSPPGDAPKEPVAPAEPVAPTEPAQPAVPVSPTLPAAPVAPTAPDRANYDSDEAYAQALAEYESAAAGYQTALENYNAALALYEERMAAYQQEVLSYNDKKAAYDTAMLAYTAEKAAYDAAMLEYAPKKAEYDAARAQYDIDKAAWDTANASYQEYAAKLSGWTMLMQQGAGVMAAVGAQAPSTTPDAAGLAAMGAALQQTQAAIQPQIAAGEAALAEAKAQLDSAKAAIDQAENTIQGNLENIWYNMGKLEDEAAELTEEKEELIKSSQELEQERQRLEQQREAENKLSSTRILLMKNESVAQAVEAGAELAESAKAAANAMAQRLEELYDGRRFVAKLSIAAAVLGLLVLPAAFELIRSRFLLIFPALLSLAAAAACVYINYRLGEDSYYAAMPVVIFALFYLLAALPRQKQIVEK